MADERNKDMTGVLFKNDRKESDKHPDRKGSAVIDGKEYWVAGWLKDGKAGQYLSMAFTPKDQAPQQKKPASSSIRDLESDIPF